MSSSEEENIDYYSDQPIFLTRKPIFFRYLMKEIRLRYFYTYAKEFYCL